MSDSKIADSIGHTSKTLYKTEDLIYAVLDVRIIRQPPGMLLPVNHKPMKTIVIEDPVFNAFSHRPLIIDFLIGSGAAWESVLRRISHSDLVFMTRPYFEEVQLFSHFSKWSLPKGQRHIRP